MAVRRAAALWAAHLLHNAPAQRQNRQPRNDRLMR
ncbi:unknown protein [Cronobacter turicensis z3032]|uniref:Uncharacterized protein n=1 Tax=Cronobacter turicensis (strain DSM 18703 / CCUG 55852 / LMG 23827 / z3032) TaxID=693216 RepID=C9Y0G0_CROTZ|nr:unknown protein [Cronobacter turicensis z3032]